MAKTIVMSLGGSLIAPGEIDLNFLKRFSKLIIKYVKKGDRFVIICGGGTTCRVYQTAAKEINNKTKDVDLDLIGIAATRLNAELLRAMFGNYAHLSVLGDPTKKIVSKNKIIIGAGWLPGHSSDLDAVQVAIQMKAHAVINLSNISYVYDKDPRVHADAVPLEVMSWAALKKLVGNVWKPGAHAPFDPVATRLGEKHKLQLVVMQGADLDNLDKFLAGKACNGTIIS